MATTARLDYLLSSAERRRREDDRLREIVAAQLLSAELASDQPAPRPSELSA